MPSDKSDPIKKICLWPHLYGVGGPASFYNKMAKGMAKKGISVASSPMEEGCQAVLVIGGTNQLISLWQARRMGIKVFQRLNGMNWVHRRRFTGINHFLRSERNNLLLATIRRDLTDGIIYQSNFSKEWWNKVYRPISKREGVVYNGVDLDEFHPGRANLASDERVKLLVIEGHLGGGHEYGIKNAYQLGCGLQEQTGKQVEIFILGDVPLQEQKKWEKRTEVKMEFKGIVDHEQIIVLEQSSHLIYTTELNAACPNSVIEAMACGLPVIGYKTGSIEELLGEEGGISVPYGSDHWKIGPADIGGLIQAGIKVLQNEDNYRQTARKRAERLFNVETMVESYLEFING